jgi:hypothetical protein
MCSIIGVVKTDVRHIQQDSPLTLALRIEVAVVRVAPLEEEQELGVNLAGYVSHPF